MALNTRLVTMCCASISTPSRSVTPPWMMSLRPAMYSSNLALAGPPATTIPIRSCILGTTLATSLAQREKYCRSPTSSTILEYSASAGTLSSPSGNDSSPSRLSLRLPSGFIPMNFVFFGRRFLTSALFTSTSILESCDRSALRTFHTMLNVFFSFSMVSGLASGGIPIGIMT